MAVDYNFTFDFQNSELFWGLSPNFASNVNEFKQII